MTFDSPGISAPYGTPGNGFCVEASAPVTGKSNRDNVTIKNLAVRFISRDYSL
jgi:hypothetical protein